MTLDPRTRLLVLFYVGILAATLERPLLLIPFLVVGVVSIIRCVSNWRVVFRGLGVGVLMVWASLVSQGLFYSESPRVVAFDILGVPFYREGMIHGAWQSLRFLTVTVMGVSLCLVVPSGKLVHALRRLGLPQSLSLMVAVAIRFIPVIWDDIQIVRRARAQRGRPIHKRNLIHWVSAERRLLVPVIQRSWQRAHVLAESLDERGYDPSVKRQMLHPLTFSLLDWFIVVPLGIMVLSIVIFHFLYLLYLWEILYVPSLRWVMRITREWL